MIAIRKAGNDPWYNLAAEEFVVKHIKDEVFMIWENSNCIVVGKHQNTMAEVNLPFINEKKIPVIRRISGGGTVFQGIGNINYSIITNAKSDFDKVNFVEFTHTIRDYLKLLGVEATIAGKSNLAINGLKFSGNAAHISKNRVLHHGTILFDADLDLISDAINVISNTYQGKAIASNRAEMCNVRSFLLHDMSIEAFKKGFTSHLYGVKNITLCRDFTDEETASITKLANEKYKSWEWNFAYSPDYEVYRELTINGIRFRMELFIHRGFISQIKSDDFTDAQNENLLEALLGKPHRFDSMNEAIAKNEKLINLVGQNTDQFVKQLL